MPLFFTVALAAGAILLLATAADGRLWQAAHSSVAVSFDPSPYGTAAECLRAAYQAGAPSSCCTSNR
jgi:hypothetical protein